VAFGLGTGRANTLLESVGAFGLAEKSRMETLYQHNMTLTKLEQSMGHSLAKD